jgi:hypothetical protein
VANEHVQTPVQQSVLNAQGTLTSRQPVDWHAPLSQMPLQHWEELAHSIPAGRHAHLLFRFETSM